jgi:hypothetical protein
MKRVKGFQQVEVDGPNIHRANALYANNRFDK